MSLVIVGSLAYDTVKTSRAKKENMLGGSALYGAIAASFFTSVNLVGVVGEDFKNEHIELLHNSNINTEGLQVKKGRTFRWEAEYSHNMNERKTISSDLNVLEEFNPYLPRSYKKSKYVFLANLSPKTQAKVLEQLDSPKLVICDTMNLWIKENRNELMELIKKVDIFILNDEEARQLTGEHNIIKAGRLLADYGAKMAIIKKGEHGALFFGKHFKFFSSAYPLEQVYDPTGSGDVFAGGFIGYLAKKDKLTKSNFKKALIYGTILASFNAESFSVDRIKNINLKDVQKRYKELKQLTRF
jgi:sugar/nucleoside kinase (ribokinase family)